MKLFVISDVHGSYQQLKKACDLFINSQAEKLVILGDLYYHGPRNKLPEGYNPMECSKLLNSLKDQVIAIKGNCDAEVDEYISEFPFNSQFSLDLGNRKILLAHGHHDLENTASYDLVLTGHTHIFHCYKENNTTFVNPGSISLPKKENSSNYLIIDEKTIIVTDINSNKVVNTINY